ncbi:HIV Tat-specific factor 1 [Sorex araneus]|uniref:HIV Tat-specific factor 1 n=1 Tax=Sorex araneus TaxID=42254 RepID=UPI00243359DF|nr:HIV Tat-specific factor 1 [Sorex araneus]
MSGHNLDQKEFDEQLRMQDLYGDSKEDDPTKGPAGESDAFGQQPADTPYEWDLDKKAWFPKITDDFIATYQANYGFSNDGASSSAANMQDVSARTVEEPPQRKTPEPSDPKKKGEKRKAESGWFHVEEDRNTNVYVSGLPPDITVDEFIQLMSKFGIIMRDPQTEEFKVKLYKDNQGNLKGDGLCCYLKRESVELALKLLDEDEIRGYRLHVEVAKFQLKGTYDASKKKKKCKDYKKKLSLQQKQLDWRPERRTGPSRMRHERVVIIKNMFHPTDFEDDPLVLNEIREDLRVECSKFGQIRKLLLFDRHPDGVASVSFREPEEADYCIQTLNGRWFGGRQITAEAWDGTTDYQVEETSREREERLKGWEAFLNSSEANKGLQRTNSISVPENAGPSRARHISECSTMSKVNVPEGTPEMAFEEPIDEKKFETAEDGGKLEEGTSGKDAKEGGPQSKADDSCLKRKREGYLEGESGEGSAKNVFDEDNTKKEAKKNGPEREPKKRLKHDHVEKNLQQRSKEGGPNKESGEDSGKGFGKQFPDGTDKQSEENSVRKEFDEDEFDREFQETVLQKGGGERPELGDVNSRKALNKEGSARESDDESEEKEEEEQEEIYKKLLDEKEDKENTDEQEEEDASEKLLEESDKKEENAPEEKDGLFRDDKSLDDQNSIVKLLEDSGEWGTMCRGSKKSVQEEGPLSSGSSFVLSFNEEDDNDATEGHNM